MIDEAATVTMAKLDFHILYCKATETRCRVFDTHANSTLVFEL